jgi:hypothetical protein
LDLEIEGEPKTPIPGDRWLRELRKWVASLDYEDIVATGRQGAFDLLPMLSLEHEGKRKLSILPGLRRVRAGPG